eukprot:6400346-Pyramimonas_sp.AAC.1
MVTTTSTRVDNAVFSFFLAEWCLLRWCCLMLLAALVRQCCCWRCVADLATAPNHGALGPA